MKIDKADLSTSSASGGAPGKFGEVSVTELFHLVGEVSWLMGHTSGRKYVFLADLEWLVVPPLRLRQAKLYRNDNGSPLAFVSWAFVSDEVDARLREGATKLRPDEWQSGPHLWVIELIAPVQDVEKVMETLRKTVFAGQAVSVMSMGGKRFEPSTYNN